jgi:hypothetical protein
LGFLIEVRSLASHCVTNAVEGRTTHPAQSRRIKLIAIAAHQDFESEYSPVGGRAADRLGNKPVSGSSRETN